MELAPLLPDSLEEIEQNRAVIRKNHGSDKRTQSGRVTEALNESFELIGGVPRLAIWANNPENQAEFYKLWARSGQKIDVNHTGEVIIRPALPRSALDGPEEIPPEPPIEGECQKLP